MRSPVIICISLFFLATSIFFISGCKKEPFNPEGDIPESYNGEANFLFNGTPSENKARASVSLAGECYATADFGEFSFSQLLTQAFISRIPLCENYGDTIVPIPVGSEVITEPGPPIIQFSFRSGDITLDSYGIDTTAVNWVIVNDYDETTKVLDLSFNFRLRRYNSLAEIENAPTIITLREGRLIVSVADR